LNDDKNEKVCGKSVLKKIMKNNFGKIRPEKTE
jgi:hypothetical protein